MIIGYAYVCADLIHVGHLNHLEACKQFCDKLVVGVLTDGAIMEKKAAPIVPFEERLRMVQALDCVDVAVSQGTYSPLPNAVMMEVDVLFESTSHEPSAVKEAKRQMALVGGKVQVMPYYGGTSSVQVKNKILKRWLSMSGMFQVSGRFD